MRKAGAGDQALVLHGEHRRHAGPALVQRGQWLAMSPTAPDNLVSLPSDPSAQGSWGSLVRTTQTMLHDPRGAREVDVEALHWNGLAMRAEGQSLSEYARVMSEEAELMTARHALSGTAAVVLHAAAGTMRTAGDHRRQHGPAMVDDADRRRSLGLP